MGENFARRFLEWSPRCFLAGRRAQRVLTAKNTLTTPDAERVEHAFQAKLASFVTDAAADQPVPPAISVVRDGRRIVTNASAASRISPQKSCDYRASQRDPGSLRRLHYHNKRKAQFPGRDALLRNALQVEVIEGTTPSQERV